MWAPKSTSIIHLCFLKPTLAKKSGILIKMLQAHDRKHLLRHIDGGNVTYGDKGKGLRYYK